MSRIVLLVLALALTGCSVRDDYQTTPVDVERVFNVARDAWAAPESLAFPTGQYGGSVIMRGAGARNVAYRTQSPHKIALSEIQAATAGGWALASVHCTRKKISATLTRGSVVDDSMVAFLTARKGHSFVGVAVPHHLDGSWPSTTPVSLTSTCLSGGTVSEPSLDFPDAPYPGDGGSPSLDDFEPWQRDTLSDEERALVEEVNADPLLAAAGAEVAIQDAELYLDRGDNWRSALNGNATVSVRTLTTRAAVSQVVKDSDWVLTWAACGPDRETEATMRIPLDSGTVTARLTSQRPDRVEISLGLPVPEAPLTYVQIEEVPALESSKCLSSEPIGPGVTLEGIPVALPDRIHPYLGP